MLCSTLVAEANAWSLSSGRGSCDRSLTNQATSGLKRSNEQAVVSVCVSFRLKRVSIYEESFLGKRNLEAVCGAQMLILSQNMSCFLFKVENKHIRQR